MRYSLITSFLILLAGCFPESDNPITDPDKENMDTAIYGTWYWKDENDWGYIHIGSNEHKGLLQVIMLGFDDTGALDISEFSGHTSSLGQNRYLNLKLVRPEDIFHGYLFVKYKMKGDSLEISLLDSVVTEKAVMNDSLKGTVTKGKWFNSVHITEDQGKLQRFILDNDEELFEEGEYLYRLHLPTIRSQLTENALRGLSAAAF